MNIYLQLLRIILSYVVGYPHKHLNTLRIIINYREQDKSRIRTFKRKTTDQQVASAECAVVERFSQ